MNNIPKNHLVRLIIDNVDDNKIRKYFSIKEDTDLFLRLSSYSIAKLDEFIYKQDSKLIKLFENYSTCYNNYMIKVAHCKEREELTADGKKGTASKGDCEHEIHYH